MQVIKVTYADGTIGYRIANDDLAMHTDINQPVEGIQDLGDMSQDDYFKLIGLPADSIKDGQLNILP